MPALSSDVTNSLRAKLIDLKLLIIDEVSMVGSRTLNRIDTRLRQIMGRPESFGRVAVLVVGDLHHLVPVMDSPVWKAPKTNELSIFNDRNPLWEEFSFYELSEIMRQKGEADFIRTLNNIANNTMTEEDYHLLETRIVDPKTQPVPEEAIWLYPENALVNAFNERKIRELNVDAFTSVAQDIVLGNVTTTARNSILESIKKRKISDLQRAFRRDNI